MKDLALPGEYADADGEVLPYTPGASRSAYDDARTNLAAFKFKLMETVSADPRLTCAACTDLIIIYSGFVTIDKRTLKPTHAYASNIKVRARGKLASETTVKKARSLLVKYGYLVAVGQTKDGCIKYRVENPHYEYVRNHIADAEDYLFDQEAERKQNERRRKQLSVHGGGAFNDPLKFDRGASICLDRGTDTDPNYLIGTLGSYGYEEEGISLEPVPIEASISAAHLGSRDLRPSAASTGDDQVVYLKPVTFEDAATQMADIVGDRDVSNPTYRKLSDFLVAGFLTVGMAERLITSDIERANA